jgi:hypothetical protein
MAGPLFPDEEERTDRRQTDSQESMDQGVSPLFPTDPASGPAPAPSINQTTRQGSSINETNHQGSSIAVVALDMPAGGRQPSPVSPLTFSAETTPQRPTGPSEPSKAFDEPEAPLVAPAMRAAAERFPEVCAEQERMLRSRLREILPFTFDGIAQYGRSDLDRNTTLMSRVTAETQQWSSLALAESIQAIVDAAKPAHGLLGRVMHGSLDSAEIHRRLVGLSQASEALCQRIDALVEEQASIVAAFKVHLAVLAVCVAMPSRFTDVIQRRAALFALADQERRLVATQIETLCKGVREGILRLDEVRNVTMPALGFLQGA